MATDLVGGIVNILIRGENLADMEECTVHNEGNGNGDDEDEDEDPMRRIAVVASDGMCEGFSRVRRGINRVRSLRRAQLVTTWPLGSPHRSQRKTYCRPSNSRDDGPVA